MSPINKVSLWQKIKRRLAASLLRVVEDTGADKDTSRRSGVPQNPVNAKNTDVDSKADRTQHRSTQDTQLENTNTDDKNPDNQDNTRNANSNHVKHQGLANSVSKDNGVENKSFENKSLKNSLQNHNANDGNDEAQEAETSTDISIVDYLKQYFDDKGWQYIYYRPRTSDSQQSHHLSLQMKNKQIECGYLFRVQEANNLLAVYGILPFLIPESHQSAAMLLITQINYDMLIGNLEMDINDGELRYKNAIDIEAVGIDDHIMEHLLQSVIAMTTVTYEIFNDLIHTAEPAEDMATLLRELRQQADARTFYLPTQFVQ